MSANWVNWVEYPEIDIDFLLSPGIMLFVSSFDPNPSHFSKYWFEPTSYHAPEYVKLFIIFRLFGIIFSSAAALAEMMIGENIAKIIIIPSNFLRLILFMFSPYILFTSRSKYQASHP